MGSPVSVARELCSLTSGALPVRRSGVVHAVVESLQGFEEMLLARVEQAALPTTGVLV